MSVTSAFNDGKTYVPEPDSDAQIIDFAARLEASGKEPPQVRPALITSDGQRIEIPEEILDVLRFVAEALAEGRGVRVAPMDALLTTQQAAEFLGVSRPTLVSILERGEIPMDKPGRHRRVRLQDLVDYQDRLRVQRREALSRMTAEARADDLYAKTDGPPPKMR